MTSSTSHKSTFVGYSFPKGSYDACTLTGSVLSTTKCKYAKSTVLNFPNIELTECTLQSDTKFENVNELTLNQSVINFPHCQGNIQSDVSAILLQLSNIPSLKIMSGCDIDVRNTFIPPQQVPHLKKLNQLLRRI